MADRRTSQSSFQFVRWHGPLYPKQLGRGDDIVSGAMGEKDIRTDVRKFTGWGDGLGFCLVTSETLE
jgi:hypothetical protein